MRGENIDLSYRSFIVSQWTEMPTNSCHCLMHKFFQTRFFGNITKKSMKYCFKWKKFPVARELMKLFLYSLLFLKAMLLRTIDLFPERKVKTSQLILTNSLWWNLLYQACLWRWVQLHDLISLEPQLMVGLDYRSNVNFLAFSKN